MEQKHGGPGGGRGRAPPVNGGQGDPLTHDPLNKSMGDPGGAGPLWSALFCSVPSTSGLRVASEWLDEGGREGRREGGGE